jgi:UDP-sugar transporter A1/2/3
MSLFIATLTSSLASAYTEKVLKNKTSASIWVENIYMSLFGVLFSLLYCLTDIEIILEKGVFSGWNNLTTLLVINQAIGGLVVAAVIKYTSAVTKSIIGSLVMILGTIISTLYMGSSLSILLALGSAVCFISTYYYSIPEIPKHSIIDIESPRL